MSSEPIRFGTSEIVIDEAEPRLEIDGISLAVQASGGFYLTPLYPYERFLSLESIAERALNDGLMEEDDGLP